MACEKGMFSRCSISFQNAFTIEAASFLVNKIAHCIWSCQGTCLSLIHRDVKADNVLLDEYLKPVVADFGLAKLMNYRESHVSTNVCGTPVRIPFEYFQTFRCSEKTDVYGYGIFLLELITGRRIFDIVPTSRRDEIMPLKFFNELQKDKKLELLVDSALEGGHAPGEADALVNIALLCKEQDPKERPDMSRVVRMLEDHGLADSNVNRRLKQIISDRGKAVFYDSQKNYDELKDLLNSKKWLLGEGRLGLVYKAELHDGCIFLIKRLNPTDLRQGKEFEECVNMIGELKHPNTGKLVAYYCHPDNILLVYNYLPHWPFSLLLHQNKHDKNSALWKQLVHQIHGGESIILDCKKRFNLLLEISRILAGIRKEYSASGMPHGNVKSSSAFADKNGGIWLSDFGESLLFRPDFANAMLCRYKVTEQARSMVFTQKDDVYSFGVLLLEVITGKDLPINSKDFQIFEGLPMWVKKQISQSNARMETVVDHNILTYKNGEKLKSMIYLGLACTESEPAKRPTMEHVATKIEDIVSEEGL